MTEYRIRIAGRCAGTHYWVVEQRTSPLVGWWQVGLYDDRMEGWSFTRAAAERRGRRKLRRYLAMMEAFERSRLEEVCAAITEERA